MTSLRLIEKERPAKLSVLISDELRDRLVRAARRSERSVGAETRMALREWLGRDDDEQEHAA